jgi:hypothetical protein
MTKITAISFPIPADIIGTSGRRVGIQGGRIAVAYHRIKRRVALGDHGRQTGNCHSERWLKL